VVVDVNGDHKDDVVQVRQTSIDVYLSLGDGTFRLVSTPLSNNGSLNTAIAFADFDGDGKVDAAINFADHGTVLKGNGDGSFTATNAALTVPAVSGITLITNVVPVVAVGDFDGDGKQDIALLGTYVNYTANNSVEYSNALWVYFGNGDATFSQPVSAGVFLDRSYFSLASGVLNESGRSDFLLSGNAFGSDQASALSVITSLPGRSFSAEQFLVGGDPIDSVHLADFNQDGKLDVMVSNGAGPNAIFNANAFAVLLNQGSLVKGQLTTSPQVSYAGATYTVTATLTPPLSTTQLSGNVIFSLDGTAVGSVALSSNAATQTISSSLLVGNHALSASWAGDSNYWPLTVKVSHPIEDFAVTNNANITIQTEYHANLAIHLTSLNAFADDISFTCIGLPTYATCTFSSPTLHLSANQSLDTQVVIDTDSVLGYKGRVEQRDLPGSGYRIVCLALLLPWTLFLIPRKRLSRRWLMVIAGFALVLPLGCGGSGSGGGGGSTPPPPHVAAGTYTITISATGASSKVAHANPVTLTVTQ
jgi:hypothetical protein